MAGERTAAGVANIGMTKPGVARASAALLLFAPALAAAQPASDYQLPPASPSPAPRAAGPVEEGAPAPTVVTSPSPAPSAAPAATPTSAPAIVVPTPGAATAKPSPRPRETPRAPAAATAPVPGPIATPQAAPTAAVAPPVETTVPATTPLPGPSVSPPADAAPLNATDTGGDWRMLAIAGALATLALAATVIFRRRRRPTAAPAIVAPDPVAPEAMPRTDPVPLPRAPAPRPIPAPAFGPPVSVTDPLVLLLDATRLSATLVNATLAYRLVVANRGVEPMTDIAIGGDMTAAHASKPMDEQLGLAGPELTPAHRIERLDPGAEITLSGEMRLPLAAVTPIRAGEAALFVPIARFDAWASTPAGGAVHARAAYLVGQEGVPAAERLQPFRLDLGPRTWDELGQRALELPVS